MIGANKLRTVQPRHHRSPFRLTQRIFRPSPIDFVPVGKTIPFPALHRKVDERGDDCGRANEFSCHPGFLLSPQCVPCSAAGAVLFQMPGTG